jgi:hypothetical protein
MKSITVEYDDVTPATIEHRLAAEETVLSMGSRRYPAALNDRAALLEALQIADRLARRHRGRAAEARQRPVRPRERHHLTPRTP